MHEARAIYYNKQIICVLIYCYRKRLATATVYNIEYNMFC